jgi:hypothetical protein
MNDKTLHKKLTINKHEPHKKKKKQGVNSDD